MNHRFFASLWANLSKRLRLDLYLKGWCWFKFSGKLNWERVITLHMYPYCSYSWGLITPKSLQFSDQCSKAKSVILHGSAACCMGKSFWINTSPEAFTGWYMRMLTEKRGISRILSSGLGYLNQGCFTHVSLITNQNSSLNTLWNIA